MTKTQLTNLVFDDHYPHNPTDKQIEDTLWEGEAWTEAEATVLTFQDIAEWFSTWDQSEDEEKYTDVHDYIRDCLHNGLHPLVSTDALEYARDLVMNMTDDDPLVPLTEYDANILIESASKDYGYSIPFVLTPEFFLELYEDMKPEEYRHE